MTSGFTVKISRFMGITAGFAVVCHDMSRSCLKFPPVPVTGTQVVSMQNLAVSGRKSKLLKENPLA